MLTRPPVFRLHCLEFGRLLQFVDNPKANSDRRVKRHNTKISGKAALLDQGEFSASQDSPDGGVTIEEPSIILLHLTAILTMRH